MTQSEINTFVDNNLNLINNAGDEVKVANKLGVEPNMIREAYYTTHLR